jgi:hypothetical protein
MKVLLSLFSITIAILSILLASYNYGIILDHIPASILSRFYTPPTTTPIFGGLPVLPPTPIYGKDKAANMSVPRTIRKAFLAVEQAEGAGARVRRSIGTPQLKNFSPFLMLDHFTIKPGAGFPDHPHRGK